MVIDLELHSGSEKNIGISSLQPADIIVTKGSSFSSSIALPAVGSRVSHAMLHAGSRTVIEAGPAGVRHIAIEQALHGATLAAVYRHQKMTPRLAAVVADSARAYRARGYDDRGTAHASGCWCALYDIRDDQNRIFCSELVVSAYLEGGFELIRCASQGFARLRNNSRSCVIPAEFLGSAVFAYVGHLVTTPQNDPLSTAVGHPY